MTAADTSFTQTPIKERPVADSSVEVTFSLNGESCTVSVRPWTVLLDVLRLDLGATGTKKGCDHGQCGACTVLIDGRRMNSCLQLAIMQDGREIVTIEGLGRPGALHPMQQAFIDHDAFQCGYCTPGQICSAVALIEEGHAGSRAEIREFMSGNICRCGAYPNIVDAIAEVAGLSKADAGDGASPRAVNDPALRAAANDDRAAL